MRNLMNAVLRFFYMTGETTALHQRSPPRHQGRVGGGADVGHHAYGSAYRPASPEEVQAEGPPLGRSVNGRPDLGFASYKHHPYMSEVNRDGGKLGYRTDLYSRC